MGGETNQSGFKIHVVMEYSFIRFGFVTFKENRSADNALKAINEDLVLEKRYIH